jgi:hypothetical protein
MPDERRPARAEIAIPRELAATLWCEGIGCRIRGRSRAAAVTLASVSLWGEIRSMMPCCDECARSVYNRHPDRYQLLPVSAYADRYAAAREAMHATPKTVAGEVISEIPSVTDHKAVREMPATEDAFPVSPATQPALPAAPEPPRKRYSPLGLAQGGEPRPTFRTSHKILAWGIGLAVSIALGIFLTRVGVHENATSWTYENGEPGQGTIVWGWLFILAPLWAGIGFALRGIGRIAVAEHRRYVAWKASLTPGQRAWVNAVEVAAAVAATAEIIHHAREMNRRNTSSAMGHTMPDGYSPRPSQQLAALRQQTADYETGLVPPPAGFGSPQPAREQFPAGPNSAAHEALIRYRPEKRDPVTGQHNISG